MLAALVMVCVLVAGLRVTSCCRCRWHLSAFAHSVTGPSNFQSVLLRSRPKTQMLLAVFGTCLTKKYSCRVSSTPSDPLVDARPPSCIVVESSRLTVRFPLCNATMCRSLARGSACLRAQPYRLCVAALPRLPTEHARIAGVCA